MEFNQEGQGVLSGTLNKITKGNEVKQDKIVKTYQEAVKKVRAESEEQNVIFSDRFNTFEDTVSDIIRVARRSSTVREVVQQRARLKNLRGIIKTSFVDMEATVAEYLITQAYNTTRSLMDFKTGAVGTGLNSVGKSIAKNVSSKVHSVKQFLKPSNLIKAGSGFDPLVTMGVDFITDKMDESRQASQARKNQLNQDLSSISSSSNEMSIAEPDVGTDDFGSESGSFDSSGSLDGTVLVQIRDHTLETVNLLKKLIGVNTEEVKHSERTADAAESTEARLEAAEFDNRENALEAMSGEQLEFNFNDTAGKDKDKKTLMTKIKEVVSYDNMKAALTGGVGGAMGAGLITLLSGIAIPAVAIAVAGVYATSAVKYAIDWYNTLSDMADKFAKKFGVTMWNGLLASMPGLTNSMGLFGTLFNKSGTDMVGMSKIKDQVTAAKLKQESDEGNTTAHEILKGAAYGENNDINTYQKEIQGQLDAAKKAYDEGIKYNAFNGTKLAWDEGSILPSFKGSNLSKGKLEGIIKAREEELQNIKDTMARAQARNQPIEVVSNTKQMESSSMANYDDNSLSDEQKKYRDMAAEAARREGIPVQDFVNQIYVESRFNPNAKGDKGEIGLAQLLPSTARYLAKKYGLDPNKPEDNVALGAKYLKEQLKTFNQNMTLAQAAYNAGPGNVSKGIIPKSTMDYIGRINGGTNKSTFSPTSESNFGLTGALSDFTADSVIGAAKQVYQFMINQAAPAPSNGSSNAEGVFMANSAAGGVSGSISRTGSGGSGDRNL